MGKPLFKTENTYLLWKNDYLFQNQIVLFKLKRAKMSVSFDMKSNCTNLSSSFKI